jgi:hypothetical protein
MSSQEETETTVSPGEDNSPNGDPPTEVDEGKEEFERRVNKLCDMMAADPSVRDRIIAETYVNFANAEMMIRSFTEKLRTEGMPGMFKSMMSRKGKG